MINTRQRALLLLALALGSSPLLAQPAPPTKTAEPATRTAQQTAPQQQAPATPDPAQKSTPPATGRDSPFDYRSSEEISEDVPVSFPVDI
jgi:uncharacterized protein involved in copper resistance